MITIISALSLAAGPRRGKGAWGLEQRTRSSLGWDAFQLGDGERHHLTSLSLGFPSMQGQGHLTIQSFGGVRCGKALWKWQKAERSCCNFCHPDALSMPGESPGMSPMVLPRPCPLGGPPPTPTPHRNPPRPPTPPPHPLAWPGHLISDAPCRLLSQALLLPCGVSPTQSFVLKPAWLWPELLTGPPGPLPLQKESWRVQVGGPS